MPSNQLTLAAGFLGARVKASMLLHTMETLLNGEERDHAALRTIIDSRRRLA